MRKRKAKVKKTLKVMFVVPDINYFVLDNLFVMMRVHPGFDPFIGIPLYDHTNPLFGTVNDRKKEAEDFFVTKGYATYAFNDDRKFVKDEVQMLSPDVVIYNCPPVIYSVREIFKLQKKWISVNVPYCYFLSNNQEGQFNDFDVVRMDYLLWESPISVEMSRKYACNDGINSYFVGYPKLDGLVNNPVRKNVWKTQCKPKKKVIWAPHATVEINTQTMGFSSFLEICDYMLEIADFYSDTVQFAFKPHPLLKHRLEKLVGWGKKKTEEYYKKWDEIENGQYVYGEYKPLFLDSDAMIMDSISFMGEYTALDKPCLFTVRDSSVTHKFNEFGEKIFNYALYKTTEDLKASISKFIEDVVISEKDMLADVRKLLINEELFVPNKKTACENIMDFLCNELR